MRVHAAICFALFGTAVSQTCADTKHDDSACEGDKYQTIKGKSVDECCAECAVDDTCVQWTHQKGFLFFQSTCYLSTAQSTPSTKSGSTCGQKSGPAPPPSPPSPPMPGAGHHWAVIIAGSNTYGNYRHQSDACHAYQIAKKNGIPESNIILLAYDDIANNRENPFPGKIFNKPDGPDVYEGCKISYREKEVTKGNFLKVLTGDSSAPGPVLKSTSNDRVFVYFADHGGVGILGVPEGAEGGYIHAKEVNDALETMHSKGMYKELLFYVEACESGSIFQGMLQAPNVVAVTAANAKESSWGFYCPPQDKVDGMRIGSCLGDEFSIRWMEDSDVANFKSETVDQQIAKVTSAVKKSHVQKFGDASKIGKEVIGNFEGAEGSIVPLAMNSSWALSDKSNEFAVNSRDIEVHLAYYKLKRAGSLELRTIAERGLAALLGRRKVIDDKFMRIAMAAMDGDRSKAEAMIYGELESLVNVKCHEQALKSVVESCGPFDDYTMRYSRLFANLCNMAASPFVTFDFAIKEVCSPKADIVV